MAAKTLTIDGTQISAENHTSILQAATEAGVKIPTLCHLEGVYDVGACRLCLVEVKGSNRLMPACTTRIYEGMEVTTVSERLQKYRRLTLELQALAYELGMDHVRYEYCSPQWGVDASHRFMGMDHNRCILCQRCVRVCWHIEGAGTKNVSGRGSKSHIISDLNEPWGDSTTCTSCGKCLLACPTGALFHKGDTAGESQRDRAKLEFIVNAREKKQWTV
jgi:bidirectional [NiFe] hydrogenase diaphorase subunit